MNIRLFSIVAVLIAGCVGLSPHSDPSTVTDAEISIYKLGIRKGCLGPGKRPGDDLASVKEFCDCVMDTLDRSLTHDQWQQAAFAAQKKRDADEARVMAPYMSEINACKADS